MAVPVVAPPPARDAAASALILPSILSIGTLSLDTRRLPAYPETVRWPRPEDEEGTWAQVGRLSSLGIYIAICIGLCTWLGNWADARWQTDPYLTVAGALLGIAAAFYGLYREVARLDKRR